MAYGPDPEGYDVQWVASTARQHYPGLPQDVAVALGTEAYRLLCDIGSADAPALARALLLSHPDRAVSELNAVAKATVDCFEGT